MKSSRVLTWFAALATLLFSTSAFAQLTLPSREGGTSGSQMQGQQGKMGSSSSTTRQTQQDLLSAQRLIGDTVDSRSGQELGEVSNFLIDPATGQVAYVILNTGGGYTGGDARMIPFKALEAKGEELSLNMDQQQLAKAPAWEPGMSAQEFDRRSAEFFGVAPVWGEENTK